MELFDDASDGKSADGSAGIGRRGRSSKAARPSRTRKTGKSPGKRNRMKTGRAKTRSAARARDGRRAPAPAEELQTPEEAGLDAPESGLVDPEEPRKEPPPSSPTSFNLSMGGDDDDLVEYVY